MSDKTFEQSRKNRWIKRDKIRREQFIIKLKATTKDKPPIIKLIPIKKEKEV